MGASRFKSGGEGGSCSKRYLGVGLRDWVRRAGGVRGGVGGLEVKR